MIDIRLAAAEDVAPAAAVHIESCLDIYRGIAPDHIVDGPMRPNLEALWAEETLPGEDFMVVAEENPPAGDRRIVGLGVARLDEAVGDDPYVEHFHVRPDMKGRGVGRRIFETLAAELRARGRNRFHLHVAEGNDGARDFYLALGGVVSEAVEGDLFGHPHASHVIRWPDLASL